MLRLLLRARTGLRNIFKPILDAVLGAIVVALLRAARYFDPDKTADLFANVARKIGPLTRENRIGRANLAAAFPEKSEAERERILAGVWDNLGRVAAEFAQLDRIWQIDFDNPAKGRIEFTPRSMELFEKLRDEGKPALIFSAHLGNWELPAVAAAEYGLKSSILFRPPGVPAVNEAVQRMRSVKMAEMIPARSDAPYRLAGALRDGRHVGMLVDQFFTGGVLVDFFGRPARTYPLLARLLRQIDSPIHGVRIVRLPGHRFRVEISEEIPAVRDAAGDVDIQGTMQAITSVIEGWVREYPEQWLWLHRRWRDY